MKLMATYYRSDIERLIREDLAARGLTKTFADVVHIYHHDKLVTPTENFHVEAEATMPNLLPEAKRGPYR